MVYRDANYFDLKSLVAYREEEDYGYREDK